MPALVALTPCSARSHKWHVCGHLSLCIQASSMTPGKSHPLATHQAQISTVAAHCHQENTTQDSGPHRPGALWAENSRVLGSWARLAGQMLLASGLLTSSDGQRKARVEPLNLRDHILPRSKDAKCNVIYSTYCTARDLNNMSTHACMHTHNRTPFPDSLHHLPLVPITS